VFPALYEFICHSDVEKALVEDTIGALCYDVPLNDLRYLVLLVSYRIDRNGFF